MLATKGIFLLFEILLYLDSCSVLFFDRLLEYIHGVLCCCFFGYKKICFNLLFSSKQGLPSETTCSFTGQLGRSLFPASELVTIPTCFSLLGNFFENNLVVVSKMYFLFF